MMPSDRFSTVAPGMIAAVATVLEMRGGAAPLRPEPPNAPGTLRRIEAPEADWYLDLYRRVGAPHLWYSRLAMERTALEERLAAPSTEVHALVVGNRAEGLLELDFAEEGACEITYFGVTAALVGTGAARRLMNRAIARAFERPIRRLWLHTNTLDHPRALAFYQRSGFRPCGRQIEIAPDPRLTGLLPRDSAPDVPLIEP